MDGFRLTGFIAAPDDYSLTSISLLEVVTLGNQDWLFAGSEASGAVSRIGIGSGNAFSVRELDWDLHEGGAVMVSGGLALERGARDLLLGFDRITAQVSVQQISSAGTLASPAVLRLDSGAAVQATEMSHFTMGGRDWLVGTDRGGDGISLYRMGNDTTVTRTDGVRDTPKTHVAHVSQTVAVAVGGAQYIVATSASESGMTSYSVGSDGSLRMVDSIGTRDGLWSSGLADLTALEVGGQTYLIGVATQSGTLVAVRLNPQGVFFMADVEIDDRDTRFAGVAAVDTFAAQGRDFVILGGTDGGLSMFELLPGGTFFHHMNAVQSLEWNIGTITGITTHLTGSEVKVFVASAGDGGLAELSLSLEDLGTRWTGTSGADQYTGTAGHDMILGGSGNDRLSGGAGNDVIHAGRGEDRLAGGSGADTFVFVADGTADRIDDFEVGVDKIDLTGWGMLYHISDLQIRGRGDGATIRFEGEEIRLVNADGTRIEAADLDQDDFIF